MELFDWDNTKAQSNIQKHDVSFEEASTVFNSIATRFFDDTEHSGVEIRELALGYSSQGHLLAVIFTERGNAVRIISARKATKQERMLYEQEY